MASILTNTGAMVALQTLKGINNNLGTTQNEIATGKKVATAKDNAAVWAISKVMESDVKGFRGIKESLSLGESTVSVARQASETITDLLTDVKGMIVAAQEENVDRSKIQTDIGNLRDQINSVVNAAQFNSLNLVKGTEAVNILSSLDRAADGTVNASNITVSRQDLSTDAAVFGTGDSLDANITVDGLTAGDVVGTNTTNDVTFTTDLGAAEGGSYDVAISIGGGAAINVSVDLVDDQAANTIAGSIAAAINAAVDSEDPSYNADLAAIGLVANDDAGALTFSVSGTFDDVEIDMSAIDSLATTVGGDGPVATLDPTAATVTFDGTAEVNEGDSYRVTIDDVNYDYVAGGNDSFEDVANGLAAMIDASGLTGIATQVTEAGGDFTLSVAHTGADLSFESSGAEGGTAGGGLFALSSIDVTTSEGAISALSSIEGLIQTSIDASAAFGSVQGRIEIQSGFVDQLTDSMRAGIGTLVDADMEETSARLQALQVQQQLAIQSLGIANQAPQNILSLFR